MWRNVLLILWNGSCEGAMSSLLILYKSWKEPQRPRSLWMERTIINNSRYLQPSVGCSCTNPPSGSRQFSYKRISDNLKRLYSISDTQGSVLGKPLKSRCNNRTVPASQIHITGTGFHFQHIKFKKLLNVHTKFHKNWATGSKAEKGTHNVHKRMLSLSLSLSHTHTHTHRGTYADHMVILYNLFP
jgi:hypothetical protein